MRPTMRFVPVKTADQQAAVLLHRGRERLVRQRTGLVNALRGHLAEFGVIAPQGLRNVGKLIAIVRDEGDGRLPDLARQVLAVLAAQIEQLEGAVAALEKQLIAWHKSKKTSSWSESFFDDSSNGTFGVRTTSVASALESTE